MLVSSDVARAAEMISRIGKETIIKTNKSFRVTKTCHKHINHPTNPASIFLFSFWLIRITMTINLLHIFLLRFNFLEN